MQNKDWLKGPKGGRTALSDEAMEQISKAAAEAVERKALAELRRKRERAEAADEREEKKRKHEREQLDSAAARLRSGATPQELLEEMYAGRSRQMKRGSILGGLDFSGLLRKL